MTKEEICKMFGCSMDQLNAHYKANAQILDKMQKKAKNTKKKVNGYTEEQLSALTNKYNNLSTS